MPRFRHVSTRELLETCIGLADSQLRPGAADRRQIASSVRSAGPRTSVRIIFPTGIVILRRALSEGDGANVAISNGVSQYSDPLRLETVLRLCAQNGGFQPVGNRFRPAGSELPWRISGSGEASIASSSLSEESPLSQPANARERAIHAVAKAAITENPQLETLILLKEGTGVGVTLKKK